MPVVYLVLLFLYTIQILKQGEILLGVSRYFDEALCMLCISKLPLEFMITLFLLVLNQGFLWFLLRHGGYSSPSDTESIDSDTYTYQAQQRHNEFTKDLILTSQKDDIYYLNQEFSTLLSSSPKPPFFLPFSTTIDPQSCSSDINDHIAQVMDFLSNIQKQYVSLHHSKRFHAEPDSKINLIDPE